MQIDWAVVIATIVSPIAAFVLSIWYQERKQKQEAKMKLFMQAMMNRKGLPPKIEWVNALNLLDVVFQDAPKVTAAWHSLYEYLHIRPMDPRLYDQKVNDLLIEMALVLGYSTLRTTNLDKFYSPEGHNNYNQMQWDTQVELLRVLKGTRSLHTEPSEVVQPPATMPPEVPKS